MNLILFTADEIARPLPCEDPRARHLLEVLRCRPGGSFDAGLVDGPRGRGTLTTAGPRGLELAFTWEAPPPPLPALTLLTGLPRPQSARDILREAATLGVATLRFVRTGRGEAAYAQSQLWRTGEWQQRLRDGAAQAFDTRLPAVAHHDSLGEGLAALAPGGCRLALDNYEATAALADWPRANPAAACLAVGAERGWTALERDELRAAGFTLVHLGPRVLRSETACVAGVVLLKARLGWL